MTGPEYQVEQPSFRGPIDLLLHLVRRHEISADTIELSKITEQYLEHLEALEGLDVDNASQFLLVATILVELKSRQLLIDDGEKVPEDDDLGLPGDFIRDLLAYRQLRDQTGFLSSLQADSELRASRGPTETGDYGEYLEDLSSWDLYEAFNKLQRELITRAPRIVTADDTPIETHMQQLRAVLKAGERIPLRRLFEDLGGVLDRGVWIGRFLALLEMAKCQEICIHQDKAFGGIEVEGRP